MCVGCVCVWGGGGRGVGGVGGGGECGDNIGRGLGWYVYL